MIFFREMYLRLDILILGLSVLGLGDIWTTEKTQINGQNVARRISIDILHLYHNPGQFALVKYYTQFFRFMSTYLFQLWNIERDWSTKLFNFFRNSSKANSNLDGSNIIVTENFNNSYIDCLYNLKNSKYKTKHGHNKD